jgi:hypothetical protein
MILILVAGVVGLNVIASFSPRLAFFIAASLVLTAAAFFVSALLRKN